MCLERAVKKCDDPDKLRTGYKWFYVTKDGVLWSPFFEHRYAFNRNGWCTDRKDSMVYAYDFNSKPVTYRSGYHIFARMNSALRWVGGSRGIDGWKVFRVQFAKTTYHGLQMLPDGWAKVYVAKKMKVLEGVYP